MTGLIRYMTLGVASAALLAPTAFAQTPTPANKDRRPASTAGPVAGPTPAAMLDLATGDGLVPIKDKLNEFLKFEPRHGYAYARGTGSSKRVFLLFTTEPASDVAWRGDLEPLQTWAERKQTPFVLVVFDDKGVPDMILETAGDGSYQSQARSFANDLPSLEVWFEINDGQRMRGHLTGGNGNCGGRYCDKRQNYYFDVTVVQ